METSTCYCSPEEVVNNAKCLLGRLEALRCVLRRMRFSDHAIECAVTAVYRAAMPYITGAKICHIDNRGAWVFTVAIRTAKRIALREVQCHAVDPVILSATVKASEWRTGKDSESHPDAFDIRD